MDISALKAHLGEELYSQVEEKLSGVDGFSIIPTNDGSWLPKSRLDDEISKHKATKAAVTQLTQQLEEAKKAGASAQALQELVDSLKTQVAERDTTITGMKRSSKVQKALGTARAKDAAMVEKLLDMEKISEDDKGNLNGLEDQIKSLKESSPYLFDEDPGQRGGWGGGKNPPEGTLSNADVNAAIRAAAGRSI